MTVSLKAGPCTLRGKERMGPVPRVMPLGDGEKIKGSRKETAAERRNLREIHSLTPCSSRNL